MRSKTILEDETLAGFMYSTLNLLLCQVRVTETTQIFAVAFA